MIECSTKCPALMHECQTYHFLSDNVQYPMAISISGVVPRYAERLKTDEIRKDQGNLKTSNNYNLAPSLPPKRKILLILAENC